MDPLSGASLAGTVIQFVQFAANLFSVAKEIHRSTSGSSKENESLEAIYSRLSTLSANLHRQDPTTQSSDGTQREEPADVTMKVLAQECKVDCDRILSVLGRLKQGQSSFPKWWKSFRSALKELWKGDEIEALEARISKHQTQLILHMCMSTSERLQRFRVEMKHDDGNLALSLSSRHEDFWKRTEKLQKRIEKILLAVTPDNEETERPDQSREPVRHPDHESLSRGIPTLSIYDIDRLRFIKELSSDGRELRELASLSEIYTKVDDVLQTVDYEHRTARHESIPPAYPTTFEWVFDKNTSQNSYFLEWLEKGSGIFWITGIPGAGKSTFIKFLANSAETKTVLRKWAGENKPLVGCHYFWSGGTSLQRSREGLLRSILHDIFFEAPELFPEACPTKWQRALSLRRQRSPAWSISELSRTLLAVVKKTKLPVSFCFFIDGLDEAHLNGDHNELCDTIIALSACPNVKICVSSRPWNRFIEYFGTRPTMSIHELTRNDIQKFAQRELSRHPRWESLANERGVRDGLVVEIVQRAHGVFLWVVLVVRQLREGLTNFDTSKDLWKRLDRIPDGLTKFFRLIVESVEPFYLQKMAETLLIAAAGQGPLHSAIYTFHDRSDANPNYAIDEPLDMWEDEQLASEVGPYSIRLSSRCKGLLEVDAFDRVNFLHRTVRDFLQMEEMRSILKSRVMSQFDENLSIFQAYICWIKHSAFVSMGGIAYYGPSKSLLVDTLETALTYAGKSDNSFALDLIDDLDWSVYRMFNTGQATFAGTETIQQTQHLFRTCILRTGLDDYSIKKLVREPQYLQGLEVPPLVSVLKLDTQGNKEHDMWWSARRVNLLQSLLDRGHDPNEVYVDPDSGIETTPWCELAKGLMPCPQLELAQLPTDYPQRPLTEAVSKGIVSMLLDHGADPNSMVEGEDSPEPLAVWCKFFLACFSTPVLAWHSDQYLKDLNTFMRKANLDVKTAFFQPLGEWLVGEPIEVVCRSLSVPTSLRAALWNILRCFLRGEPPKMSQPRSYRDLQFYAKVIQIFLRQDDLSKLPLDDIRAAVQQGMPVSLVPGIIDVINDFLRSHQDRKSPTKRRRPLDGGDQEMAFGLVHNTKAPRLSFICNVPNENHEMLGGQVGRRYGEVARA
ncbi:hypothetical protein Daus18300_000128 [Diaporthe australafricana]|uniref:NACHT domain-containing protein n=1 Tax=Diaporthe australafricana TaxID=127596 RepID=A0ABR3Y6W7_9PEZI